MNLLRDPMRLDCRRLALAAAASLLATACGGSSGDPRATYAVGGIATGLNGAPLVLRNNGGDDLTVVHDGPFAFARRLEQGRPYAVTIGEVATGRTCSVSHGTGNVGARDVLDVSVACLPPSGPVPDPTPSPTPTPTPSPTPTPTPTDAPVVIQRWTAPATWGGSATTFWDDSHPALIQHVRFDGGGSAIETKSARWRFAGGTAPQPERLDAFPAGPRFGAGPFDEEGVNYQAETADPALDVEGDLLVCAVVRPDFDPVAPGEERPIVAKGHATDSLAAGGWALAQTEESFAFHYHLRDGVGAPRIARVLTRTFAANQDPAARDVAPLPSWVVVCGGRDGANLRVAVNSAADTLNTTALAGPAPQTLDAARNTPATLGGYTAPTGPGSHHVFRGRIYETAVWRLAATPENIQARLAEAQGLAPGARYTRNRPGLTFGADGKLHMTWRHGPRLDAAKGMLFGLQSWNRVNFWKAGTPPTVFAASEDLSLWQRSSGALLAEHRVPTPTGVGHSRHAVTLPPGESLSLPLNQPLPTPETAPAPWWAPGLVHAQLWVLVGEQQPPGAVLRVRKDFPDLRALTGGIVRDHYDVALDELTPGTWKRFWLQGGGIDRTQGLSTSGERLNAGTLFLENGGATPISFHAWGITATHFANGGDLNSLSQTAPFERPAPDPGPLFYDPSAANDVLAAYGPRFFEDVLQLPQVPSSTAATGFCLQVDAQPADGVAWDVRVHASRTPIAWANHPDPAQVSRVLRLYIEGMDLPERGKICFGSRALRVPGQWSTLEDEVVVACGAVPAGWAPGSRHSLKACATAAGALSIYADHGVSTTAPIATGTLQDVPDLGTGRVLIGNGVNARSSYASPWQGYVAGAAVCRATDIAACE